MGDKTSPSKIGPMVSLRGSALTPSQAPTCVMTVDEASALRTERDKQTFYFCGDHCRQKFLSTPAQSIAERGRPGLLKEP
jgi:YHS domain-containing protein